MWFWLCSGAVPDFIFVHIQTHPHIHTLTCTHTHISIYSYTYLHTLDTCTHWARQALAYAQFSDAVDGAGPGSAALYQRAFSLNPLDSHAAAGLALHLHHFSSETQRTDLTYQQALLLNPRDVNVLTNYALFKEELHRDIGAARSLLEQALELEPSDIECRTYYAQLLHQSVPNTTPVIASYYTLPLLVTAPPRQLAWPHRHARLSKRRACSGMFWPYHLAGRDTLLS